MGGSRAIFCSHARYVLCSKSRFEETKTIKDRERSQEFHQTASCDSQLKLTGKEHDEIKMHRIIHLLFRMQCANQQLKEIDCSECNGVGKIIYTVDHPLVIKGLVKSGTSDTCWACRGHGKLLEDRSR